MHPEGRFVRKINSGNDPHRAARGIITIATIWLLLSTVSCAHYIEHSSEAARVDIVSSESFPKENPKIALIGFYGYTSRPAENAAGERGIIAEIDYSRDLKQAVGMGVPAANIPFKGFRKIQPENRNAFIEDYIQFARDSGFVELAKVFNFDGDEPRFKRRDVDFYIMGIHVPPFSERRPGCLTLLPELVGWLTLGTVPIWSQYQSGSIIHIYDGELEKVGSYYYDSSYSAVASWWFLNGDAWISEPSAPPPLKIWSGDVKQFSEDFQKLLEQPSET
ncbi:MAG: hypothetical protein NXI24_03850 [bacterium]|nr:hypothetical protein [bacterium]